MRTKGIPMSNSSLQECKLVRRHCGAWHDNASRITSMILSEFWKMRKLVNNNYTNNYNDDDDDNDNHFWFFCFVLHIFVTFTLFHCILHCIALIALYCITLNCIVKYILHYILIITFILN